MGGVIHHGDALEWLQSLDSESVDCVVADPPYGINTKSDGRGKLNPWADLMNAAHFYRLWIGQVRRLLKPTGCLWSFLNWRSLPTFMKASCDISWQPVSCLVWDKEWIGPGGSVGLRPAYEMVALWAMPDFKIIDRSTRDIWRCKWSSHKPHKHPAEKPEELVKRLLTTSNVTPGSLVIDPFTGSGTTWAAANQVGARFLGCEQDARWVRKAQERCK